MSRSRQVAGLLAAACLAFPAGALAQGAGDDQYTDPFAGDDGSSQGSGGGGGGGGSGSSGSSGSGSTSGSGSGSSSGSGTASGSSEQAATQTTTPQGELPRTGADPGLVALLGLGFVLTGAGLRVRLRRPVG